MPDDAELTSLPVRVRSATPWVVGGQVVSQVISLATLAALYRLIEPRAFGLFGMALAVVMLLRSLATLGLSAATVQRAKLDVGDRAALFWMQTALGALLMGVALLLGPSAARWYGAPPVAPLIDALAASVLVASMSATHQALLERRLAMARVTIVRLVAQSIGAAAAITAAWQGWEAKALVVQQYGELLSLAVSVWIADPWLPGWPRSFRNAASLLQFSGYYSLSSLAFAVAQNADKLLLGLWLGDTPTGQAIVGAYTQAYNLMMRPVYLVTTPVSAILLPALSRAAGDEKLFHDLTRSAFRLAAMVLLPCSVGLFVVAPDLMLVLGGDRWQRAGLLLAALAPAIFAQGWINLCGSVLAARGRAGLLCFNATIALLVLLQAYTVGFWFGKAAWPTDLAGGALGMASGLSSGLLLVLLVPYVWLSLRAASVPPRAVFAALLRPLRASLVMGAIVLVLRSQLPPDWPPLAQLVSFVLLGVITYILLALRDVKWLLNLKSEISSCGGDGRRGSA